MLVNYKLVKSIKKYKHQFLAGLFALLVALSGCEERSDFGMEILPKEDLISIKNIVIKDDVTSYIFREDSIRTDESANSLLGSLYDPAFGITNIDFATQFRLQFFPGYGTEPQADSIKLFLYYKVIYGDTVTAQKFRVYELDSPIDIDAEYNQHVDLKSLASDQLLGEIEYMPKVKQDSVSGDTLLQIITIPLDISLAEKLINADSLDMINNDAFLEYFKGLYIETEQMAEEGGTILSLEAASNAAFQGSALAVYYNNEEIRDLAVNGDTSIIMPFVITNFSARVNSIEHDYTNTAFGDNINTQTTGDTLIYIQATGGLKSKILIDNLESWKDSVNIAINKAELIFEIDTIASKR